MTQSQKKELNRFFVETFNKIVIYEEKALCESGVENLSVKELHIIEAVGELEKSECNTMSDIAKRIHISVGALTTAVNTLVRKGYLTRASRENDRRIVLVCLSDSGTDANKKHELFHKKMIEYVGEQLDANSLETLCSSLGTLSDFFEGLSR